MKRLHQIPKEEKLKLTGLDGKIYFGNTLIGETTTQNVHWSYDLNRYMTYNLEDTSWQNIAFSHTTTGNNVYVNGVLQETPIYYNGLTNFTFNIDATIT